MSKKSRFIFTLSVIVIVVALTCSIGVTVAVWIGDGGNEYITTAPVTDWNIWQKYFECENVYSTDNIEQQTVDTLLGVAIVSYSGVNIGEVIIPKTLAAKPVKGVEAGQRDVIEIRNTLFNSTALRSVPVTIKIPPTVKTVQPNTFSNMPALTKIVFGTGGNQSADAVICQVYEYAFAGCASLAQLEIEGWRNVKFLNSVFSGAAFSQSNVKISVDATVSCTANTFLGSGFTPPPAWIV